MNNKNFILVITFIVFTYITSIVHSQYITQVSKYFTNNRPPKYSYENFIKASYTSLPLLPINILINVLIISLVSAVIYIMFISLFTKQNNDKNSPTIISTPDSTKVLNTPSTSFSPKSLLNLSEKSADKFKSALSIFKGGSIDNAKELNIPTHKNKVNIFRDYLKSLSSFELSYNIFKWFIYVLIFNIIYFIVFLILIKTNIIDKNKFKDELYIKSIIHYYITGFYISSSIIYLIIVSNM